MSSGIPIADLYLEEDAPFARATKRAGPSPVATFAPDAESCSTVTDKPVSSASSIERQLGHVDFFEQAVVVDGLGNLIAAVGADTDAVVAIANVLRALMGATQSLGGALTCELTCDGRTFFGVREGGLFALVAPTRREMTDARLAALRSVLAHENLVVKRNA